MFSRLGSDVSADANRILRQPGLVASGIWPMFPPPAPLDPLDFSGPPPRIDRSGVGGGGEFTAQMLLLLPDSPLGFGSVALLLTRLQFQSKKRTRSLNPLLRKQGSCYVFKRSPITANSPTCLLAIWFLCSSVSAKTGAEQTRSFGAGGGPAVIPSAPLLISYH